METLAALWLPIFVILFTIAIGALSWFVFVRSIDIPWDDRNRSQQDKSRESKQKNQS
ncbi:hypothetical protein [Rubinisphaera sp.]|uniref:hypothetical protein n=1 Tax=Rubinisphaera sp. TaxID=2024857 RepID=UPI0025D713CD|nr:hypothetical protein [Rubinisphaera sp.]|tara:strand:+ start:1103 stop:1273 length:171 start_codon:yes stop_codon:yes gene_type:complete